MAQQLCGFCGGYTGDWTTKLLGPSHVLVMYFLFFAVHIPVKWRSHDWGCVQYMFTWRQSGVKHAKCSAATSRRLNDISLTNWVTEQHPDWLACEARHLITTSCGKKHFTFNKSIIKINDLSVKIKECDHFNRSAQGKRFPWRPA